ncbi:MAG: molybdopterin synthase catalytic subunit MoaE [Candidatus Thioglobus sp.]|uniref:molybdopterin synthase catalytic subunit MoaE n=1 Tax=Candidatus Thioglobus sp. TaxID=2026721 RepID=UPI00260F08A4|nr:molybdopterin synthase catalytic subunit MoaE [Candidatus Thioglobus sp.]MDC9727248.1 molybdopterin synthase catalytic subunit MoaE [Candidatus Thioglobus sp.]
MNKILVQEENFDLTTEVALARGNDSDIGAVVSFVGTVRDLDDASIKKMTLEHYPQMTEKALNTIVEQAQARWPLGNTTVIHRVGELNINDQIVLVITTSKHRKAAFKSCEFIMDYLKTQAPFWKKEHTNTDSKWVEAKDSDTSQVDKWR